MKIELMKNNISELTFTNIEPNKINFLIAHNGRGKSTIYNIFNSKNMENYKIKINDKDFNKNLIKINCSRQEKYAKKTMIAGYTQAVIDNKPKILLNLNKKYNKKDIFQTLSEHHKSKINLDNLNNTIFNKLKTLQQLVQKIKKTKWFIQYKAKKNKDIKYFCEKSKNHLDSNSLEKYIKECCKSLNIKFDFLITMLLNVHIQKLTSYFSNIKKENKIREAQEKFNNQFPELKSKYKITKEKNKYILNISQDISRGQTDLIYHAFTIYMDFYNEEKIKGKNSLIIIDEVFDYLDLPNIIFILSWLKTALCDALKHEPDGKLYCLVTTHLDPRIFWTINSNKYYKFIIAKNMMHDCIKSESNCSFPGQIIKVRKRTPEAFHVRENGSMDKSQTKIFKRGENDFKSFIENNGTDLCPTAISFHIRIYLEQKILNDDNYSEDFANNYLRKEKKNLPVFIKDKLENSSELPDWFNNYLLISPILNQILHPENKSISKLTLQSLAYSLGSEPIKLILKNLIK